MSRATDLLREAADALDDGRDPLLLPFLDQHDVTLDECFEMAESLATGALLIAWVMDNPKRARDALAAALDDLRLRATIRGLGGEQEADQ